MDLAIEFDAGERQFCPNEFLDVTRKPARYLVALATLPFISTRKTP